MSKLLNTVYDKWIKQDYIATETDNLNPIRDVNEIQINPESEIAALLGEVQLKYDEIKSRYDNEVIEDIKKAAFSTGNAFSVDETYDSILAKIRVGNENLFDFADGLGTTLPIEKQITDLMMDLLVINNYLGVPEKGNNGNEGGTGGGGGGGGSTEPPPPPPGTGDLEQTGPTPVKIIPPGITGTGPKVVSGPIPPEDTENVVGDGFTTPENLYCPNCNDENALDSEDDSDSKATSTNEVSDDGTQLLDDLDLSGVGPNFNITGVEPPPPVTPPPTPVKAQTIAECAKMDLQLLQIILNIVKIVKVLSVLVNPTYVIVTQLVEITVLVVGCWRNPINISEVVQRLLQMTVSIVSGFVTTILDKLWKMLGINCLSDASIDLINQIQEALKGLRQVNTALNEVKNQYIDFGSQSLEEVNKVLETINSAQDEFTKKRENTFKSLFSGEDCWSKDDFNLQTHLDGNTAKGWLSGQLSSMTSKSILAKEIKEWQKKIDEIGKEATGGQYNPWPEKLISVSKDRKVAYSDAWTSTRSYFNSKEVTKNNDGSVTVEKVLGKLATGNESTKDVGLLNHLGNALGFDENKKLTEKAKAAAEKKEAEWVAKQTAKAEKDK